MKKYLSKIEAERLMEESNGDLDFLINQNKDKTYQKIRNDLLAEYRKIIVKEFKYQGQEHEIKIKKKYQFDLLFGLKIYEYFNTELEKPLELRDASNIEFWIYLSVITIPDIVSDRWSFESYDRFFKNNNRVWLFTLWWYIHLSWQGSIEDTYLILKDRSTDTILNLVDRTGRSGYDVTLYRVLMREYSKIKVEQNKSIIFRSIMVTNTSLTQTTQPALYKNGYDDYICDLFDMVGLENISGYYELKGES